MCWRFWSFFLIVMQLHINVQQDGAYSCSALSMLGKKKKKKKANLSYWTKQKVQMGHGPAARTDSISWSP
jgi:hypothetical protein